MHTITITQNSNPIYNETGYVVGFSCVESKKYKVTDAELEEILNIDNDGVIVKMVHYPYSHGKIAGYKGSGRRI
jgi:hypothetical protein